MSTHTFVGLERPNLSALWHNDLKHTDADGEESTEASLEQKIKYQDGTATVPCAPRIRLDCDPTFDPAITTGKREDAGDAYLPWPVLIVQVFSNGTEVLHAEIGEGAPDGYAKDTVAGIQSPENDGSLFRKSEGYAPIVDLAPVPYRPSEWHFSFRASDGKVSPALVLPKVAGK